jgi:biotin carboxyl carrier protein
MRWRLKINESDTAESAVEVELLSISGNQILFRVGDEEISLSNPSVYPFAISTSEISLTLESWTKNNWRAVNGSQTYSIEPLRFEGENLSSQNEIRTQMPGRVLKVLVKVGDLIEPHQTLVIMEAMKMENEMRASARGRVKAIAVESGVSVESGALLMELEPASNAS